MNENKNSFRRQESLLKMLEQRSGKYFPIVVVALAQVVAFPFALVGTFLIQVTANLSPSQLASAGIPTLVMIILGNFILLGISFFLCREVINRLGNPSDDDTRSGLRAWKEITSFPWKYGSTAFAFGILFDVLPVATYMYSVGQTNYDQYIYGLIGGFVSAITSILLAITLIEAWLQPVREKILPKYSEDQIRGTGGIWSNLFGKYLISTVTLIIISILMVVPIGYRQTTKVLYEAVGSLQVLNDLRAQTLFFSIAAVVLGTGLVFLLTRSITTPLQNLINTFRKVELGDLSQRASVIATDEIGQLAIYFNRMISRLDELQQSLEKRVEERTEQLRVSNEVGRIATTILDPDIVITRVVNLITQAFGYYYAAIFIVSKNERWVELIDATGTAGETLKNQHHRLPLTNTSMVGNAVITRQPQVALDTGEAAIRFNNPLLPNTRSEIAIPLIIGDRVIGALDVQSTNEADFKADNISILQSMANQVAIAIENARLFREMEQTLLELQQSNRKYLQSSWTNKTFSNKLNYTTGSPTAYGADGDEGPDSWKEINFNLNLRDQKIGQITLETGEELDRDDRAWVEALATQVAISLENARLIEESQQSALRDRLSATITQKLWMSNSIDSIIQTAVSELGQALDASEATIELKMEE